MEYGHEYYDKKWLAVLKHMPKGGEYRFDMRQHCYDLIQKHIPNESSVFDYAAGLGVIDIQLEKKKACKVYGSDWSKVACDYIKSQCSGDFRQTDDVFGGPYDVIIAIYFLEHISKPVEWLQMCFKKTDRVIVALPRNFSRHGEHIDMAWKDWNDFDRLFGDYERLRLDVKEGANPHSMADADLVYPGIGQFAHPVIEFRRKNNAPELPRTNTADKKAGKKRDKKDREEKKREEKEKGLTEKAKW